MSIYKHHLPPEGFLITYTGGAGRQFKFALDSRMDRQYRQAGIDFGLLHALALRMALMGKIHNDLRPYIRETLD